MDSTAILVEAERKFTIKLCNAMTPVMVDSFYELYKRAIEISGGRQTFIRYQILLQEVQHWNNTIVKQHTDAIIKSTSMFPNLLAAVFVISVKIMSAVRISGESKKINIKLPSNDVFVHSCYIAAAKSLYKDPKMIAENIPDDELRLKLSKRFSELIKEIIDDFIPVQQILDTYIPNFTGELDMSNGPDPADPEMIEEEPEPAPEPEGTPAPEPQEGTPATEPEGTPVPEPEEGTPAPEDVKKIPVHQETLFDDAKD
jgi:hypothetical protein